jgi:hypothetical protein
VSSTQVTAVVPTEQLTTGATLAVTVVNGATSGTSTASFVVNNPLPSITQIAPASFSVGSAASNITVSGTNFLSDSVVQVGGTARTTTFVSATSLLFQLTVVDQATASNLSVTVVNPAPGGGSSTATTLAVDNPVPGSITLSPSSVPVGTTTATTVTVTGTNFLPVSSVQIGGAARSTTYVSATQLTFQLTVADQAVVGSLSVKVVNPAPGGGTSPTEQLLIVGSDNRLRTLNYPTLDIVSDPIRNLLYASVSSSSATSPNSIVAIDPLQGTVVATQAMSAQPGQLAVTDDGSYLYVSLPSTGQVSRLLLPLLTPDIQWSLGTDGNGRIYAAEDLEAAPGKPHTVAATRFLVGFGNNASGGLAVYDDGVARSLIPSGTYLNVYDRAAWGSDSTTIFASNTTMSGGNVYVFSINQNGPTLSNTLTGALSGFAKGLTFDKTTGRRCNRRDDRKLRRTDQCGGWRERVCD